MDQSVVITQGVTRAFTPQAGVFDLNLDLPPGRIIGLIGPSGSGKTTTVRLLTGILRPDEGSIRVLGKDPTRFNATTRARIGYMPQEAILYPDLTLGENLEFAASLYGMPMNRTAGTDRLVDLLDLGDAMSRFPDEASGGERRRLMLAATLIHQPELLFLDEPTAGIDPVLRRKVWDRFGELSEDGKSLIVTTQYVGEAAYCDYVAVLAEGRVLVYDTPSELRRRAFDGELMDVVFATPPGNDQIEALVATIGGVLHERLDANSVRLVVSNAGEAAPVITRWSQDQGVELRETQTYTPPFDDVFVALVERLRRIAA